MKSKTMLQPLLWLLVAGFTAALALPVLAENDTEGPQDEPDRVVVTAQRREEDLQDVPIAITALDAQFIDSRGIDSIDQLGVFAPNVKVERAPASKTTSQIAIRGSVTINPAITWEPAVGLYLDGVYIAKAQGSIFDIADLERVEILRGPQGTLYGRNALAGAVNLVTRKPSGEAGGQVQLTYGSFNERVVRGVFDLPRMGSFTAKVAGQYKKRDGLIKLAADNPAGLGRLDDLDSGSFLFQLRGEISSTLTADYLFDYSRKRQTPPFSQLLRVNRNGDPRDIFDPNSPGFPFGGAFFPLHEVANPERIRRASIDGPVYDRSRSFGHSMTLTWDLGDAEFKSITAYRDLEWGDGQDLDGSPLPVAFTQRISDYRAFSQELQLAGLAFNGRANYVMGAFFFDEKAATLNPQTYFGGGLDLDSNYASNTEAWAAYAQLDYELTDAWKLIVGARYTREKKDISRFFRINFDGGSGIFSPLVIADIASGDIPKASFSDFSPTATLAYSFNDNVNVYGRYARGFKSGGFNGETNVFGAPTADCPTGALELCEPYRPEVVNSYEIGIKSQFLNNRVVLNAAAFRNDSTDMQLSVFTATTGAASVIQNAGAARIQGVEFETVVRASSTLTGFASLAFLDPSYRKFIDGDVDVSDNRAFPHAPKRTASASIDWQMAEGSWGRLNFFGDLNYVSGYHTFPYPLRSALPSDQVAASTRSAGRTILNLRGTMTTNISGMEASFSVFVRNLTNENDPSNFIDFGPGFGGILLGYFPDPRTFGVTAGFRF